MAVKKGNKPASKGIQKIKTVGNRAKQEAMKIVDAVANKKLGFEESLESRPKRKPASPTPKAVKNTTGTKLDAKDIKNEKPRTLHKIAQPAKKKISFEMQAPSAQNVLLLGDFNQWDYKGIQMKRLKGNGNWKTSISLGPGTYQYKFLVDNHWAVDEKNPQRVTNEYGSENSVIQV